jgi:hypothetical protein
MRGCLHRKLWLAGVSAVASLERPGELHASDQEDWNLFSGKPACFS